MTNTILSQQGKEYQNEEEKGFADNPFFQRLPKELKDAIIKQRKQATAAVFKRKNTNVPAEGNYTHNTIKLMIKDDNDKYSGKEPYAGTLPILYLEKPSKLQKHWPEVYGLGKALGLTHFQAMIARRILDLQAYAGQCYASSRYLAKELDCSEKTVDRAVATFRDKGFIETTRLSRPWGGTNKTDSTNLIDIRSLWALILELLMAGYQDIFDRLHKWGDTIYLKIHGAWVPIEYLLSDRTLIKGTTLW